MQITLNQSEIEAAIREHINRKVEIQEGLTVRIELKAGRGPEGFTANIDLVDPAEEAAKPQKSLGITEKVKAAKAPAQAAKQAPQEAADKAEAPTPPDAPADPETAQDAADGEQEGTSDEPPAKTEKPTSLFGNLGKPRN